MEGTSINETPNFFFDIFPNPIIDGIVTIQVDNTTGLPFAVKIYDESGKLVFLTSIYDTEQIDLSKLNIGSYFVEIFNSKARAINKVIKN